LKLSDIGKVLFVDDDYSTIADVVESFLDAGIPVQYWKGSGELPSSIFNVRIVVVDLDLTDLKMRIPGDEFFIPAVDALKIIPGPFIVVIVAREFKKDDPARLEKMYLERTKAPLVGFIADAGLTKEQLEDPRILEGLIVSVLEKNEILHLILSWEGIFDRSKDAALHDIMASNVEAPARALVNILCSNFGETKATARELIDVMTRLVSRRTSETEDFNNLVKLISGINKTLPGNLDGFPSSEDLRLYSRLMFYLPPTEEDVTTGDIYETPKKFQYGIVLTPKCDLTQEKTDNVLVCYGFPLKKECFLEKDFPAHKSDPEIAKLHKENVKSPEKIAEIMEHRYFTERLPQWLPILWNFCPEEKNFGICLDFRGVQSVEKTEVKKWKRLSRIDSPYIEEILQKYGSMMSRIGTLEINRSPFQLQKFMKKVKEEAEKPRK
jgi:hypothetical protein